MDLTRLPQQMLLCALFALAAVLGYAYWSHRLIEQGRQLERAEWVERQAAETLKWERKLASAGAQASAQLASLKAQHEQNLNGIRLQLAATLRELRQRPTRAALEEARRANPASAPTACTGLQLAGDDAEFLARFAERAAVQQAQLHEAVGQYEACRGALRSVTDGNAKDDAGP